MVCSLRLCYAMVIINSNKRHTCNTKISNKILFLEILVKVTKQYHANVCQGKAFSSLVRPQTGPFTFNNKLFHY